jgi:hypothetical protein
MNVIGAGVEVVVRESGEHGIVISGPHVTGHGMKFFVELDDTTAEVVRKRYYAASELIADPFDDGHVDA